MNKTESDYTPVTAQTYKRSCLDDLADRIDCERWERQKEERTQTEEKISNEK